MKPVQAASRLNAGQTVDDAQTLLQERADVREHEIRRGRAHADEIDVRGAHLGGVHRAPRRMLGEIGRGLALGDDVAALDAGAAADPFVAGVDQPLQIGVGQNFLRQKAAGAGDA